MLIEHLDVKNYRICSLDNGRRKTISGIIHFPGSASTACIGIRSENIYVLFAAEKDYLFVKCGHALKFKRLVISYASLKIDLDIISDVYRVKSAIESDTVYTDVGPRDICILYPDISRSCNNICFSDRFAYLLCR